MEKKRRWYFSQMGVSIIHKNIGELVTELMVIDKTGMDGDSFQLKIIDMTDEDHDKLNEFEG